MKEQLKSKRNILLTSLILIVVVGIFGFLGTLSIFKVVGDLKNGIPITKTIFAVPLIFYPFLFYTVYYLLNYFPSLKIDIQGIKISTIFRTSKYSWTEIKGIKLTGKQNHKFLFATTPMEAATIQLIGNSQIYLWMDYYRNRSDIRIVLDRANNILQGNRQFTELDFNIVKYKRTDQYVYSDNAKEFNGNHLLSANGIFFYGWLIFISFVVFSRPQVILSNYGAVISLSFVTLVFTIVLSYQMHNFKITDHHLIVRNTFWFWRKDIYPLEEIREIVIEPPGRLSTSLRVITKDFHDKLYPAGSLHRETWKRLIEQFLSDKIKVRDETIR